MNILSMISGPVIGACIGYMTNYIAVKMLFYPRNPIKIGKFTLPFTPGIIPKRRSSLAKAIGTAVGENLFTGGDIENLLLSDSVKSHITDAVFNNIIKDKSIKDTILLFKTDEEYDSVKKKISGLLTDKILTEVKAMDIAAILSQRGREAVKNMLGGNMLSMFINDKIIDSFCEKLRDSILKYIDKNGRGIVLPVSEKGISDILQKPILEIASGFDADAGNIKLMIEDLYTRLVTAHIKDLSAGFNIQKTVEDKVNGMDIAEIENLVLSVMKKELNTIIKLGAPIGFIVGLINNLF